jgi:hypothetical protein
MRASLALLVVLVACCGEIKTASPDAGPGGADAAPDADPGHVADPLVGSWTWWIGDPPDTECDVTIEGVEYEVYCGSDPVEVATDCMRTKNDTRIQGTWDSGFAGTFDEIERYEGTGCAAAGHPTVGVDIVTEDVLAMGADHTTAAPAAGFLQLAYGAWDWEIHDTVEPSDMLACQVSFEAGPDANTVAFRVECLEEPTSPVADCTQTGALVIDGTLTAAAMAAEGWDEDRYQGSGCSPMYPDPVVEGEHTPMSATRE